MEQQVTSRKRTAKSAASRKFAKRDWLTVADVADQISVHPQTIRKWIRTGRLPAYYVLGCVRIDPADLDAVVARRVPVRGGAA